MIFIWILIGLIYGMVTIFVYLSHFLGPLYAKTIGGHIAIFIFSMFWPLIIPILIFELFRKRNPNPKRPMIGVIMYAIKYIKYSADYHASEWEPEEKEPSE